MKQQNKNESIQRKVKIEMSVELDVLAKKTLSIDEEKRFLNNIANVYLSCFGDQNIAKIEKVKFLD